MPARIETKKDKPKTKCDEVGFKHAWLKSEFITSKTPDCTGTEKCINCGLIRAKFCKTEKWYEYAENMG